MLSGESNPSSDYANERTWLMKYISKKLLPVKYFWRICNKLLQSLNLWKSSESFLIGESSPTSSCDGPPWKKRKISHEVFPGNEAFLFNFDVHKSNTQLDTDHNNYYLKNKIKTVGIYDLPPELLLLIFSYFTVEELCLTIAPVCKTWYHTSRHPSLWKNLSFIGTSVYLRDVCDILLRSPNLKDLTLIDRMDITDILTLVYQHNTKLETLIIKRCRGSFYEDEVSPDLLIEVIKHCSRIRSLTIQDTPFNSTKFFHDIGYFLPGIKKVNFTYDLQVGRLIRITFVESCKSFQQLRCFRYLPLKCTSTISPYYDSNVKTMCWSIGSTLTVLKLTAGVLSDDAMSSIVTCTRLKTLHLRYAFTLTSAGIMKLTHLTKLTSLYISAARAVETTAWCNLMEYSDWSRRLKKLGLELCPTVNDDVLICISKFCHSLEWLRLSGCRHVHAEGLSHVIKGCNKIRYLNIFMTGDCIFKSFPLIPKSLPNLEILVYKPVNEEEASAIRSLKMMFPTLTVEEMDG